MSAAGNRSMHSWVTARRAALVTASFAPIFCAALSPAEPLATVEYQPTTSDDHREHRQ